MDLVVRLLLYNFPLGMLHVWLFYYLHAQYGTKVLLIVHHTEVSPKILSSKSQVVLKHNREKIVSF